MNKNFRNTILVALTTLTLAACGGGGGSDNGGDTNPPTNPPSNSAPVLTKPANFTMDENTSRTVTLSASDANGDSLTYTASASGAVSTNVSGKTLTLTSSEVDSDTSVQVSVTANDGKGGTDTETFTVTVKNVVVNTPPSVVLSPTDIELDVDETEVVAATLSDKESDVNSLTSEVAVSNPSVISAALDNEGNVTVTALDTGVSVVTYTVTDEGGMSSTAEVSVTVIETETENEAPDFSIVGQSENSDSVTIYHDRETVLNIEIDDPDSDAHYITLTNFDSIEGTLDSINGYEISDSNKTISFDMKAVPNNLERVVFEMDLSVIDDSENKVTKKYRIVVEKSDNASPIFTFSDKVGAFVVVEQNGTKEFTYTIQDDDVSKVNVTGMQYWYGDQSKFNIQLDTESQTITVTTNGVEVEDSYGFVLQYVDSSLTGNVNVELMVGAEFGADEQEMLDLKNKMIKARESIKEYVYVGAFYSQVLENLGYITEQQAEDFLERLDIDDSDSYAYGRFNLYINNIDYYISIGEFKDQGFKSSYITVLTNLFEQAQTTGRLRYTVVNEMAALSNETLPTVGFESTVNEYDTENNYFSRFVGNASYGEYVDGEWVFDSEYTFLDAVNAQMIQNALRNIGS
tara:strand:+ start:765 stop:2657 length:1893 start_codon:yes stop_codon:yes gene_type:complete